MLILARGADMLPRSGYTVHTTRDVPKMPDAGPLPERPRARLPRPRWVERWRRDLRN